MGFIILPNSGHCSWYEFAARIFELLGLEAGLRARRLRPSSARRQGGQQYSVLAHERLKQVGLDDLRSWPEALEAYLKEKGHLP
jgi:dTDP-4-dehydrorhamnose reductase